MDTCHEEPIASMIESLVDSLQPYELEAHSSAILVAS
jgi:hypothetical protein